MPPTRQREEVINVELARLLAARGIAAAPETVLSAPAGTRLPDVVIGYRGLRVMLEGKIGEGPGQKAEVEKQAEARVSSGLAHIAIAILYPSRLGTTPFQQLPEALEATTLRLRVYSESGASDWMASDLNGLNEQLGRAYDTLVQDEAVNRAIIILRDGIAASSRTFAAIPTATDRLAKILGIERKANGSS